MASTTPPRALAARAKAQTRGKAKERKEERTKGKAKVPRKARKARTHRRAGTEILLPPGSNHGDTSSTSGHHLFHQKAKEKAKTKAKGRMEKERRGHHGLWLGQRSKDTGLEKAKGTECSVLCKQLASSSLHASAQGIQCAGHRRHDKL